MPTDVRSYPDDLLVISGKKSWPEYSLVNGSLIDATLTPAHNVAPNDAHLMDEGKMRDVLISP
jgi:hypothetical protein